MKGSLQKKGNVYYAVISIKNRNGKFQPKWINTKCTQETEAKNELVRILHEFEMQENNKEEEMLFSDYLDYWLDNIIILEVEKSTWEGYVYNVKTHIIPYFKQKKIKLRELNTIHLQAYFKEKFEKGRTDGNGGLSANLLKKHYANLKKALDYAVHIGYIKSNPVEYVSMPKIKKFIARFITREEAERLIKSIKDSVLEAMIVLAINYGLRRGELLGLRWQDIDFKEKSIYICNTRVKVKEEIEKRPKSDASLRTLPLMPGVESYLLNLRQRQVEEAQLLGNDYTESGYVCRNHDGTPININSCNRIFRKLLKENDLPDIRLHDLRHSTGYFLLKSGVSMKEIQIWLGHADISTAMNIYGHVDYEMKKVAAGHIDNMNFVF